TNATHTHTHPHTQIYTQTCTYIDTIYQCSLSLSLSLSYINRHTHIHTHTHSISPYHSPDLPVNGSSGSKRLHVSLVLKLLVSNLEAIPSAVSKQHIILHFKITIMVNDTVSENISVQLFRGR